MKELISGALFFGPALSLLAYEAGLIVKRKFKLAILNPLLIATTIIIGVLAVAGIEYEKYNESAKYISYFLTPATVALAVPLYEQLSLLKKHFAAVMSGIIAGVMASMISILLLSKLFGLTHEQYVTLLPKSITTAIGMGVSEEMGGIVTITVAVIIITGIVGGITAEFVYMIFRITEPVSKPASACLYHFRRHRHIFLVDNMHLFSFQIQIFRFFPKLFFHLFVCRFRDGHILSLGPEYGSQ